MQIKALFICKQTDKFQSFKLCLVPFAGTYDLISEATSITPPLFGYGHHEALDQRYQQSCDWHERMGAK